MMQGARVVVIGSGPSGAMAADQLVRQGIPVTMLESGSNMPQGALIRIMGRNIFRHGDTRGFENGKKHVSSGDPETRWWTNFSPGGLSNQWTGAVPRFAPEDFYEGERLHERFRWPIRYEDIAPYYDRVDELLCVTADACAVANMSPSKAAYRRQLTGDWRALGTAAARRGQGLTVLPLANGKPWLLLNRPTAFNSFSNIVLPLLTDPHFQLLTGAHALQLEYSGAHGRVTGVLYHDRATGGTKRLAADAVVVACGPLSSTKLLFDSTSTEFQDGLGNSRGLLGRYLHDHPKDWWTFHVDRPLSRDSLPAYLTRLPYAKSEPLLASAWTIGILKSAREKLLSFTPMKGHEFAVQVLGTTVPTADHYAVPDASSTDEFGLPRLNIRTEYEDASVRNIADARDQLLSLFDEAGYCARLLAAPSRLLPGDSVHYGGTIRMHDSPEHGMLDRWNRLHEVPNVLVVDASCFTTGPEKNPTVTHMAIAARAADRLATDLRTGGAGAN